MACTTLINCSVANRWMRHKTMGEAQLSQTDLVASRLEKLIQCLGQGYPPSIQIPSVIDLATLYHCDILSLLASLKRLYQHAYDYRMSSLDLPLLLVDPLSRFRCRKTLLHHRKRLAIQNRKSARQLTAQGLQHMPESIIDEETGHRT